MFRQTASNVQHPTTIALGTTQAKAAARTTAATTSTTTATMTATTTMTARPAAAKPQG